jgi:hypothetical protein
MLFWTILADAKSVKTDFNYRQNNVRPAAAANPSFLQQYRTW